MFRKSYAVKNADYRKTIPENLSWITLTKIGRDVNGNGTASFKIIVPDIYHGDHGWKVRGKKIAMRAKTATIQTAGNMPKTQNLRAQYAGKHLSTISPTDLDIIKKEAIEYLLKHGSPAVRMFIDGHFQKYNNAEYY